MNCDMHQRLRAQRVVHGKTALLLAFLTIFVIFVIATGVIVRPAAASRLAKSPTVTVSPVSVPTRTASPTASVVPAPVMLFDSDLIDDNSWRAPSSIPLFLNPIVQVQLKPGRIPVRITLGGLRRVEFLPNAAQHKACILWIVAIGDPSQNKMPIRDAPVLITNNEPIDLYGFCEQINLPGQAVDPSRLFPNGALKVKSGSTSGDVNAPNVAALDRLVKRVLALDGNCLKGGINTKLGLDDLDTQVAVHLLFASAPDRQADWKYLLDPTLNPLFARDYDGIACLLKGSDVGTPTPTSTATFTYTPTSLIVVTYTPTPIPFLDQRDSSGGTFGPLTLGQRGGLIIASLLIFLAIAALIVLPILSSQRRMRHVITAVFVFAMSLAFVGLILQLR